MATEFEEMLLDVTYPNRGHIDVELADCSDPLEFDQQHTVIVLHYEGQSAIIVPFTVPGDFSLEIGMFDADGKRRGHRLMSLHGEDSPWARNEQPCDPTDDR